MVHSVTAHSVLARWMLWLKHWSVDSVSKQGLFIFWGGNSLERLGDAIWWVSEGGKNKKSGLLSQELTHCFPADRPMINSYVPGTEYSCSWHASHISAGEQPSARPATHLKLQKKKKNLKICPPRGCRREQDNPSLAGSGWQYSGLLGFGHIQFKSPSKSSSTTREAVITTIIYHRNTVVAGCISSSEEELRVYSPISHVDKILTKWNPNTRLSKIPNSYLKQESFAWSIWRPFLH